jgi:hypothetical protein
MRPSSNSTLAAVECGGRDDAALQPELEARGIGARVGLAADVLVREVEDAPNS